MSIGFDRMKRDRLHPHRLEQWRSCKATITRAYRSGAMGEPDARDQLIKLGYRSDALKVELIELARERRRAGGP